VQRLKRLALLVAALAAALPRTGLASQDPILRAFKPVPDEYIVVLKPGVARPVGSPDPSLPTVPEVASQLAAAFDGTLLRAYEYALQGFAIHMSERDARELARDPKVEHVEENSIAELADTQFNPPWGLDRIDQRHLPLNGTYVYGSTATNVHVFVIDTGLRLSHLEFSGRISAGFTAISDGRFLSDCNGHGTHVTGTLAGTTYGGAKAPVIHPVRVFGCGSTTTVSAILAGVDWVTSNSHLKPAVANMSLVVSGGNTSLDTAVRNSIAAGQFSHQRLHLLAGAGRRSHHPRQHQHRRLAVELLELRRLSGPVRPW
jgi:subtilisin family serine protease